MFNSAQTLKNYMRAAAERLGSASKLASLVGMKQPQMQRYVAGDAVPDLATLDRIAAALGTTPADLLGGVTPPPELPPDFLSRLGRLSPLGQRSFWKAALAGLEGLEAAEAGPAQARGRGEKAGR